MSDSARRGDLQQEAARRASKAPVDLGREDLARRVEALMRCDPRPEAVMEGLQRLVLDGSIDRRDIGTVDRMLAGVDPSAVAGMAPMSGAAKLSDGPGAPLADGVRRSLESVFGQDLSSIRVHAEEEGQAVAKAFGAEALASGRDIFVANPAVAGDASLMAHEVTHVVSRPQAIALKKNPAKAPQATPKKKPKKKQKYDPEAQSGRWIQKHLGPYIRKALESQKNPGWLTEDWIAAIAERETGFLIRLKGVAKDKSAADIAPEMVGDPQKAGKDTKKHNHGFGFWQNDISSQAAWIKEYYPEGYDEAKNAGHQKGLEEVFPEMPKHSSEEVVAASARKVVEHLEEKRAFIESFLPRLKECFGEALGQEIFDRAITASYNGGKDKKKLLDQILKMDAGNKDAIFVLLDQKTTGGNYSQDVFRLRQKYLALGEAKEGDRTQDVAGSSPGNSPSHGSSSRTYIA